MAAPSNTQPNDSTESLDLAALGKSWTPPDADASPEVSDVIAEVPWWAARGLLYIIVLFIIAALVWANFSMVDVTVAARGALVPEGNVRPVQAAGAGIVQRVFVREGDTVVRGQPLVQLDATELRTRLNRLRDELASSQQQLRRLRTTGPVTETLEQESRIARLESEIAAVEITLRQTTVTATTGGVVTTLDVRSAGAVLEAGQRIATIAPAGARLVIEALVPNRDITFIERGTPAILKFDAFPYQDYGTIPGAVIEISPDAIADEQLGSVYRVTIAPERYEILVRGRNMPLRPGLALTAEIVTERRSILEMILEPFRSVRGEA